MDLCRRWYDDDDASALPRNIATRDAFENAMALDVAMGGSTNTVLHILAAAQEGEIDFDLAAIDAVSRRVPCLSKVAPNSDYHMEDVHRAGGIPAILGELWRGGLLNEDVHTVHSPSLEAWLGDVGRPGRRAVGDRLSSCSTPRRAGCAPPRPSRRRTAGLAGHRRRGRLHPRRRARLHRATAGWPCCAATSPRTARSSRRRASPRSCGTSRARRGSSRARRRPSRSSSPSRCSPAT